MDTGATTWLVAGSPAALTSLAPLIEAHRRMRPVRLLDLPAGGLPSPEWWRAHLDGVAAVMIAGDGRHAPRLALGGVFLADASRRRVPAGWLPGDHAERARYARAAASVVRRAADGLPRGPLVLLAQWEDRALQFTNELEMEIAENNRLPLFRWSAERVMRHDLLAGLCCGLGGAIYCGHGNATGWLGYGGVSAQDLAAAAGEPIGAIISLSCSIATRARRKASFAEELVTGGLCAAVLGAAGRTLHLKNRVLGRAFCAAIAGGAPTLGEALTAVPPDTLAHYRIIGDPLAPLVGARDALARSRAVFAPAPNDPLPPLAPGLWESLPLIKTE